LISKTYTSPAGSGNTSTLTTPAILVPVNDVVLTITSVIFPSVYVGGSSFGFSALVLTLINQAGTVLYTFPTVNANNDTTANRTFTPASPITITQTSNITSLRFVLTNQNQTSTLNQASAQSATNASYTLDLSTIRMLLYDGTTNPTLLAHNTTAIYALSIPLPAVPFVITDFSNPSLSLEQWFIQPTGNTNNHTVALQFNDGGLSHLHTSLALLPTTPNLATVMGLGNSVGGNSLNMNNQTITNAGAITGWNVKDLTAGTGIAITNTSGNYTITNNNATPMPTLQAGGLLTNNGTTNIAFSNPALNINTAVLVDWTLVSIGQTIPITLTATPSSRLIVNVNIRITYGATDFLTGTITSISGNILQVQITAFSTSGITYSRTNVLASNPTQTRYNAALFKTGLNSIPANSFIWSMTLSYDILVAGFEHSVSAKITTFINPDQAATTRTTSANDISFGSAFGKKVVQMGFTTASSFLWTTTAPFRVDYILNYGQSTTYEEYFFNNVAYYAGEIRGFTLPYSSGSVSLLEPLLLGTTPFTSTGIEWINPPQPKTPNIEQVLIQGSAANNQNISGIGSLTASTITTSTLNYTTLNPAIPAPFNPYVFEGYPTYINMGSFTSNGFQISHNWEFDKYEYDIIMDLQTTITTSSNTFLRWFYDTETANQFYRQNWMDHDGASFFGTGFKNENTLIYLYQDANIHHNFRGTLRQAFSSNDLYYRRLILEGSCVQTPQLTSTANFNGNFRTSRSYNQRISQFSTVNYPFNGTKNIAFYIDFNNYFTSTNRGTGNQMYVRIARRQLK
jgi:hypothetical protein